MKGFRDKVDFTDYIWLEAEFCGWCGRELPPIYDKTDIMECYCGYVVDKLDEFSETDIVVRGDVNADGRADWGPIGRFRPPPVTSPYPNERIFPSGVSWS